MGSQSKRKLGITSQSTSDCGFYIFGGEFRLSLAIPLAA
jgi:hypothetical protein